jgi:hypothetical protein
LIAYFVVALRVRTEPGETTANAPQSKRLELVKTLNINGLRVRITQLLRDENGLVTTQGPETRTGIAGGIAQLVQSVRQLPRKPRRGHRTRRRIRRTASIQLLRECARRSCPNILVRIKASRIEHHENRARHRAAVDVHGRQQLTLLAADKPADVLLRRAEPVSDPLQAHSTLRKNRANGRHVVFGQRYARHPVTVTSNLRAGEGSRKTSKVVNPPGRVFDRTPLSPRKSALFSVLLVVAGVAGVGGGVHVVGWGTCLLLVCVVEGMLTVASAMSECLGCY